MIRTLLTSQLGFDVVEELGDLLQIAKGQPGEARSRLSLLQQLVDVCLDNGEYLLQSLGVGAETHHPLHGELVAGNLAADVEGTDLELFVADGAHAEVELGEDAFAGFEPVAASSVEHEKSDVVGEDWRTKRLLVVGERDVVRAYSELEVVDSREES